MKNKGFMDIKVIVLIGFLLFGLIYGYAYFFDNPKDRGFETNISLSNFSIPPNTTIKSVVNKIIPPKIDEYHWASRDLTYNVSDNCFNLTKELIDKSFVEINNKAGNIFTFTKQDGETNISINCYKDNSDYDINYSLFKSVGLADVSYYPDSKIITKANIKLYGASGLVVIEHEVLHSLGLLNHSVYGYSVMSPYKSNDEVQYIDNETINEIKIRYPSY